MRLRGFHKNMLKAWDFTKKIDSATDALIIIYRKFPEQIFLRTAPER